MRDTLGLQTHLLLAFRLFLIALAGIPLFSLDEALGKQLESGGVSANLKSDLGVPGISFRIKVNSEEINIQVKDQPLPHVLSEVQKASGVAFVIPEQMAGERVTADIVASDWSSAIKRLLENFNTLDLWLENEKLQKVHLLNRRNDGGTESYAAIPRLDSGGRMTSDPENNAIKTGEKKESNPEHSKIKAGEKRKSHKGKLINAASPEDRDNPILIGPVELKKMKELAWMPSNKLIPAHYFNDPDLKKVLEKHGLQNAEDGKDPWKVTTLRRTIQKELRELGQVRRRVKLTGR